MLRVLSALRRHRQRALHGEGGFTLIELVIASGLLALVMSSLAYMGTVAFGDAALARNRQVATGLANEALEQVRALPYDTVALGLDTADLQSGGDPAITAAGGVFSYGGETIPNGNNGAITPLVPHRSTVTVDRVDYTVAVYVTYLGNDTTTRSFRVTASVSWVSALRAGTQKFVDAQTVVYSPTSGSTCGSTATHVFAGPCQPFLYATTEIGEGAITISPYDPSAPAVSGLNLRRAILWLSSQASYMQLEQVQATSSTARTSGVEMENSSTGATSTSGRQIVSAASDSDPSQPKPEYATASVGTGPTAQTSGTIAMNDSNNGLTLTSSGGDTASATATVRSSATNTCTNTAGGAQLDLLPCGNAESRQGGAMSAQLNLNGLGDAILASVGSPSEASIAHVNFDAAPQASSCTTTSGDGCIRASHKAATGAVRIAGLPAALQPLAPAGFDYLIKLDGYCRTVVAEAGIGNASPSVGPCSGSSTQGTIRYWNGIGYSSLTVGSGGSATIPVTSLTVANALTSTTLSLSGIVRTGGTTSGPCPSPCQSAEAEAESPLVGDLRYTVIIDGAVVADLSIHIDFGTVVARAEYTPSA